MEQPQNLNKISGNQL